MAKTTSEEIHQMGVAADFASNRFSMLRETVMSSTMALSSSANELRDRFSGGPASGPRERPLHLPSMNAPVIGATAPAAVPEKKEETEREKRQKKFKDDQKFELSSVWDAGAGMLKMAMDLQQTQKSFELMTQSGTKAEELMSSLQDMGFKTPFSPGALMKDTEALLQSGTAADDVMKTLIGLGNVSRGNSENMSAMTKAFAQVQTDGNLTADALKEMVGAGFNPLEEMSRTSGQSMESLTAQMEAGTISAGMLAGALATATAPGGEFFGTMTAQSNTAAGRWQEFSERLESVGATLGNTLLPVASDFLNNLLIPMSATLQYLSGIVTENKWVFGLLASAIGGLIIGYKMWALWQGIVNLVMDLCPATWIVMGIMALVGVLAYLWSSCDELRAVVMGVWNSFSDFGKLLGHLVIDTIKGVINGIAGLGEALMYVFQGDWAKAWETGKNAVKDLVGINAIENAYENGKQVGKSFMEGYNQEMDAARAATPATAPKETGWSVKAPGPTPVYPGLAPFINGFGQSAMGKKPAAPPSSKAPATTKMAPRPRHTADTQAGGAGAGAKDKVEGITSGGARNIVINLQKLFDNINISSTTLKEGVSDMEQIVTESLLRVLNSANAISI